jgi:uncharacterized protein (TIGR03437 family)
MLHGVVVLVLAACTGTMTGVDGADGGRPGRDARPGDRDGGATTDDGGVRPDAGSIAVGVTPGGPVVFFSDLANGPRSGNSDTSRGQTAGEDGAFVTVWGKNLGDAQGDSTITVGGAPARVYSWGPATRPADLHSRMGLQMIELQVPGAAPLGSAPIQVVVGGVTSNELAFTTRDAGRILFVAPSGDDGNAGTFDRPLETFDRVAETIENGDVVYFMDGFSDDTTQFDTGLFGLSSSGTRELPKTIASYPGATVTVGGTRCEDTGHAMISTWSSAEGTNAVHWVISKLRVVSPPSCVQDTLVVLGDGFRLVGTYLSNPQTGDGCQSGSVTCGGLGSCGSDIYLLGNELAFAQTANRETGSKQCHGFYISGNRVDDGVETNREIAWNYLHDNDNNRGINIYNESYDGAGRPRAMIEGHRVHDNWVENQRGIGILMGADVTGENWIYNNVFVHTGLGPVFPDGGAFYPFQLQPGSEYSSRPTTLHVHHNLVYGRSYPEVLERSPELYWAVGLIYFSRGPSVTLEFGNNIVYSTSADVEYVEDGSDALTSANNLWFGAGGAPSSDEGGISADPAFVDPSASDFHLAETSPARNAGVVVLHAPLDFDGIPRVPGSISLGPYQ